MNLLQDLTLETILSRLVAYLVLAAIHGFVLAGTARLLGDMGPTYAGRFTLNPFIHLSLPALAMTALFKLGWIVPMQIRPERLRFRRWGLVICVLVSVAAVLLLVPLLWPLRQLVVVTLPRTSAQAVLIVLDIIQDVAISFGIINLLPLPPLTGSLFLLAIRPSLARWLARSRGLFEGIMVVLIVTGVATTVATVIINIAGSALFAGIG